MNGVEETHKNIKIKTLIDFDASLTTNIKSLAVKNQTELKVTSRFANGKMLILSEISLKSFIYDTVDVFYCPDDHVKKIYEENEILKCFLHQNLTDTDSCSFSFIFVCKDSSPLKQLEARHLILEILRHSKIAKRLDSSHGIWKNHDFYKPELQKQASLHEFELINNPNILTISINPKEHYEEFRNRAYNKKQKG